MTNYAVVIHQDPESGFWADCNPHERPDRHEHSLAEMVYLIEKGRISASALKDVHAAAADPQGCPMPWLF